MTDTDHPNKSNNQPKKVEFFPEGQVEKELGKVPERHRDRFLTSLMLLAQGEGAVCTQKKLGSIDRDIYELCINGSPAWRCVFYTGEPGKIVVLHATDKTTNGSDRQIATTVKERLKALQSRQKQGGKS